jgi:hypothetical protein
MEKGLEPHALQFRPIETYLAEDSKIDRSLARDVTSNADGAGMFEPLIGMGRATAYGGDRGKREAWEWFAFFAAGGLPMGRVSASTGR